MGLWQSGSGFRGKFETKQLKKRRGRSLEWIGRSMLLRWPQLAQHVMVRLSGSDKESMVLEETQERMGEGLSHFFEEKGRQDGENSGGVPLAAKVSLDEAATIIKDGNICIYLWWWGLVWAGEREREREEELSFLMRRRKNYIFLH
jgi:hypothetical protein